MATRLAALLLLLGACSPVVEVGRGTGPDPVGVPPKAGVGVAEVVGALTKGDLAAASALLTEATGLPEQLVTAVNVLAGRETVPVEEMDALLRPWLDRRALGALQHLSPETPAGGWVHTRLALIGRHGGGDTAGLRALRARLKDETLRAAVGRLLAREVSLAKARSDTIGVLLPLSGPYGALGESALRSLRLAIGKQRGIRLVIKDTRGDASMAARLVESLVHDHGCVAILGPIGAFESTAAASRAAELGVPLLVLSAREGLAERGATVFRTRVTASRQGMRLARYAFADLGIRRYGLLVNDSPYGWALAGAFWDEVVRLGGEITAAQTYPRGTRAWRSIVQGLVDGKKGRAASPGFEGLLVADDHHAIRKLAPFFPYWGMRIRRSPAAKRAIQLLGGNAWNHPSLIDEAEQQTDNAIFCDSFFPDEDDSRIERFVTRFYGRYREPPTPFEAEVFDAARLLHAAVRKAGSGGRAGVVAALGERAAHRGVTGVVRFDESGEGIKDVTILTVHRDAIRPRVSEREERVLRRRQP